jgi:hypothetical protein
MYKYCSNPLLFLKSLTPLFLQTRVVEHFETKLSCVQGPEISASNTMVSTRQSRTQQQEEEGGGGGGGIRNKARVSLACCNCRCQKIKCDGIVPCKGCFSHDSMCTYEPVKSTKLEEHQLERHHFSVGHKAKDTEAGEDEHRELATRILARRDSVRIIIISGICVDSECNAYKVDKRPCCMCGKNNLPKITLLCDNCDDPYHIHCVGLEAVPPPEEKWVCTRCVVLDQSLIPTHSISGTCRRPRPSKVASDLANLEMNAARDHYLYHNVTPQTDGLYHCPWEKDQNSNCQHKPDKLKCNYEYGKISPSPLLLLMLIIRVSASLFVDSHLKPYKCQVALCKEISFSSAACLLRHEREAHAMHGHGNKPFLCTYDGCERSVHGNGFPRHWNSLDHMKRAHNDPGHPKSNASESPRSAPTKSKKRKAGDNPDSPFVKKGPKRVATPLVAMQHQQPQEPGLPELYHEKQRLLSIINQEATRYVFGLYHYRSTFLSNCSASIMPKGPGPDIKEYSLHQHYQMIDDDNASTPLDTFNQEYPIISLRQDQQNFPSWTSHAERMSPPVSRPEKKLSAKELLAQGLFPTWKENAAGEELDSPDEMQKDPLATQIWRLYSKTKKQLPNQERMENLTSRIMGMSLLRRKREEAARYVLGICHCGSTFCLTVLPGY